MTAREYVYWLCGFFEITGETKPLTVEQVDMIKRHLNLVFKHEIDASYLNLNQEEAQAIHDGKSHPNNQRIRC